MTRRLRRWVWLAVAVSQFVGCGPGLFTVRVTAGVGGVNGGVEMSWDTRERHERNEFVALEDEPPGEAGGGDER